LTISNGKKPLSPHAAMDTAVLGAYGWSDLQPTCEFLLDYEEEEGDDDTGTARRKKTPWRFRWSDEFRDTVFARLLELNKQWAEQEKPPAHGSRVARLGEGPRLLNPPKRANQKSWDQTVGERQLMVESG
jgi:hypothetical protein